jgi:glycosyltransferase involved in cell wall biosynthesis
MKPPKISVLLPCLNARPFLEERIESLLAQTFSDWEAIVLDSYSDDGSWEYFGSIAAVDSRFRLFQIPRDGLYVALNRGIALAAGEFLHIATCDDTMLPNVLEELLNAFDLYPEAGVAACDLSLITASGDRLTAREMEKCLPRRSVDNMLSLDRVRSYPLCDVPNYRRPPHDCMLHFSAKSVYFSLTQLLIRTTVARSIGPFAVDVGAPADIGWLQRLTNVTGTVHIPKKLTMWRFHGPQQLSVQPNPRGVFYIKEMFKEALPEIRSRHQHLLDGNQCAMLMLPVKAQLARSWIAKLGISLEAYARFVWLSWKQPAATRRAVDPTHLRVRTWKETLIPMLISRMELAPEKLAPNEKERSAQTIGHRVAPVQRTGNG